MGGPHFDGVDHLGQINPVALGKQAPFVQERQNRGPIRIFYDLAGFALNGPVQNGQGVFFHVEYLA